MKTVALLLILAVTLALTLPAAQAKPRIKILATGGTIAGAQASSSEVAF